MQFLKTYNDFINEQSDMERALEWWDSLEFESHNVKNKLVKGKLDLIMKYFNGKSIHYLTNDEILHMFLRRK